MILLVTLLNGIGVGMMSNTRVEFDETNEMKDQVFNRVIEYYFDQNAFHGEVIMQSDDCIIAAPNVLADIADNIIKFQVEYE